MKIINKIRRKIYVFAMIRAINLAGSSKTNGLRAIKRFERINLMGFDPLNPRHLAIIAGCGEHEDFFRKAYRILAP